MKIKYLKKYGCYFYSAINQAYLLNFNSNRIIQVPVNFEEALNNVSNAYTDILRSENIIDDDSSSIRLDGTYLPTSVTFLMTTKCNLNCVYCYAYNNCNKDLTYSSTKVTIDYLINNAVNKRADKIVIRFHGLGEPTQNFDVIQKTVDYAKRECKKQSLSVIFHITSNGVMKDEQREFIYNNFDYVTLSIDGTKAYQNVQRPLLKGDSFDEAIKTLDAIKNKDKLLVRTTVTNFSLENLEEWFEFLDSNGIKNINIEPVSVCGNCQNNGVTDLDSGFCGVFNNLCHKFNNMKISYSCFRRSSRPFHCGAYGDNMVVTPFDDITTCYECYDNSSKSQSLFIIGKICDGSVFIDNNRLNLLKETCIKLRNECSNCFAQTFCNGSCLSKRYKAFIENGNSYSIIANKCKITKQIIFDKLKERISSNISFAQSERLF